MMSKWYMSSIDLISIDCENSKEKILITKKCGDDVTILLG